MARAAALAVTTCSQGRRAAAWNSYMISLIPYPTHTAVPGPIDLRSLTQQVSIAMRLDTTQWCNPSILSGLDFLYGVRGAPRCPAAVATATAAHARLRLDVWGPAPLKDDHERA